MPTPQAIYSTEDYIIVETGFFGPPDARLLLSPQDFSLRINGKKATLSNQHYELSFHSLKDPEWEPPAVEKSKTSLNTGGGGQQNDAPPAPPKMPIANPALPFWWIIRPWRALSVEGRGELEYPQSFRNFLPILQLCV